VARLQASFAWRIILSNVFLIGLTCWLASIGLTLTVSGLKSKPGQKRS
jgi:hypothetical protein